MMNRRQFGLSVAGTAAALTATPFGGPLSGSIGNMALAADKLKVVGRWGIIAIIAVLYSIAMFVGAGLEATLWGFGLALAGLPIRAISRWLNGSSRAAAESPAAPRE